MRIAMLTIGAGRGGVVNVVWQLASGMVRRGHEVAVMCDDGSELSRLAGLGVAHYPVKFHLAERDFFRGRRTLSAALRAFRPDVIHSHSRWPAIVCRWSGYPVDVSTFHAEKLSSGQWMDRGPFRRLVGGWGRHVTVLSDSIRDMLVSEAMLSLERVEVIPNSANENVFRSPARSEAEAARRAFGIAFGQRSMLFVGALTCGKRPWWCIRALAAAVAAGVDAVLLIVGDGPEQDRCRQEAERLGVVERVRMMGWLPEPVRAYWAADLLVLPSEVEGFALVCVEAMLCGVPVLRTACGGADLQIVEGVTGFATDPADESAFVARTVSMLSDAPGLRRMGEGARAHALPRFTESVFFDRFEALYQRCVAE